MFNNSNDLPFDPINLQVHPISFGPNNPPYLPSQVNCPDALYEYVPEISALLANEIQSKATAHNANFLRVFMYNQCAPNNFATESFDDLLQSTLDFIVYLLTEPVSLRNPSIQNAINYAVPEMVYMMAANNCRVYPALGNEVPRETVGTIKALIEQYDYVGSEINNMRRGGRKSSSGSFGNASSFGGGGNNNNRGRGSFGGGGSQGGGNDGFGSSFGRNAPPTATGRSFGGGAAPQRQTHAGSLFSNTKSTATNTGFGKQPSLGFNQPEEAPKTQNILSPKAAAPKQEMAKGNYPQPDFNKGKQMSTPASNERISYLDEAWVPSARYPYFPAFRYTTQELCYEIQDDGSTKPILKQRDPDMDYDRHAVPTTFGKINEAIDLSKTAQNLVRIQRGAVLINSESTLVSKAIEEQTEVPQQVHTVSGRIISTSITEAWLNIMLKRAANAEIVDVFRGNATIAFPVMIKSGEEDIVKALNGCMTYVGLREQLMGLQTRMTGQLYHVINTRMAKIVTRSVRQELGIPNLTITDFVNDLDELTKELEVSYGKAVLAGFRDRQEVHIKEGTNLASIDDMKEIVESFKDGLTFPDGREPSIVGLSENVSLTLLNCDSQDLELELGPDGIGSSVTEQVVPELYQLVKGIFDTVQAPSQQHHYVRTNDGRIMEATRGALGDDHYLLALVE